MFDNSPEILNRDHAGSVLRLMRTEAVRRVGGWKATLLSGEGLVTDFVGPGKLIMQTRHFPAFVAAIAPYLPKQG